MEPTDTEAVAPTPPEASEPAEPQLEKEPASHPLHGIAVFLGKRKAGPRVLVVASLAVAGLAALCFVMDHMGLAGVLGLIALLLGELSLVPAPAPSVPPKPLVRGLNVLVDMTVAGAIVMAAAGRNSGAELLLALLMLGLLAWLPHLDALLPVPIPGATLWRRFERLGILLLGAVLGHPFVAPLLVVVVGAIDAWLAIDRLARVPDASDAGAANVPKPLPGFLRALLRPDGTLQPLLRWGSLVIAVLLMLVLPRADSWRF